MKTQKLFILITLGLSLTACSDSEPASIQNQNNQSETTKILNTLRIDATNYETYVKSIKAIEVHLTKAQKYKFEIARGYYDDVTRKIKIEIFNVPKDEWRFKKSLHNLTMHEVFIRSHNVHYDVYEKTSATASEMEKKILEGYVEMLGGEDKVKRNTEGQAVMISSENHMMQTMQLLLVAAEMSEIDEAIFQKAHSFIMTNAITFYEADDNHLEKNYEKHEASDGKTDENHFIMFGVDGMTGKEVIAKAKNMRAEMIRKGYKPIGSFE